MTRHTESEREDCPVCGGKPFIRRSHDADGMRWSHVECKSCGLRTRGKWVASSSDECPIFFQEVWEEWPRRAPAAPVPQGWREALTELMAAMRKYEMDVDGIAPEQHRAMMRRAELLLAAAPQPLDTEPDCLTCNDHGAVGNILNAEPCHDCTMKRRAGCSVSNGETQAAPVQLPEPVAYRLRNTAFRSEVYEYFRTKYLAECRQKQFNASVDDGGLHELTPIYTDQQVRALLAAEKIESKPIRNSVLDDEYLRDQKIKGEVQAFRAGARFAETFHGIGKDKA